MESHLSLVREKFLGGCNCCQSLLVAYCEEFGLDSSLALQMASGMGSGVGQTGHLCGFVNAGALLIGLRNSQNAESVKPSGALCHDFIQECQTHFGSVNCHEMLKIASENYKKNQIPIPEGRKPICTKEFLPHVVDLLEKKYLL